MSLETDLYDRLVANAGVFALVGNRIYPGGNLPEKPVTPCIVFGVVLEQTFKAMGADLATREKQIQLTSYASLSKTSGSVIGARTISEAVHAAINRWIGTSSVQVKGCYFIESSDGYEPEVLLNFTVQKYRILYQ